MIVFVNGEENNLDSDISVLGFIQQKSIKADSVVVELNGDIIETSDYSKTLLKENDRLEIIEFVGGG